MASFPRLTSFASFPQVNIESLQCIASSLLVVCLDEQMQNVSDQTRSWIPISFPLSLHHYYHRYWW